MKIENKPSFKPVLITLETPDEVRDLVFAIRSVANNHRSYLKGQNILSDLFDELEPIVRSHEKE